MTSSCCMKKRLNSISLHHDDARVKRFAGNGNNKILSAQTRPMKIRQHCGKSQSHGLVTDNKENRLKLCDMASLHQSLGILAGITSYHLSRSWILGAGDALAVFSHMFSFTRTLLTSLFLHLINLPTLIQPLTPTNHFGLQYLLYLTMGSCNRAYQRINILASSSHIIAHSLQSLIKTKRQTFLMKTTRIRSAIFFGLFLSSFHQVCGAKGGFGCNSATAGTACLPKEYSKYELPNPTGANPIEIELLIQEVLRINDKDYSITFSCYYNIYWPDMRIRLSADFGKEQVRDYLAEDPSFNKTMNPFIQVPMNLEMIKYLWLPNILIYNLKTYKVMDVLSKLAGLWISADYSLLYSQATHITFICPMHFDKFPLDTQSCKFQVGSYSYDDTQMTFETKQAKYDSKDTNSIALDYAILIKPLSKKDSILLFDGLGNFSLAGFEMVLDRYVSTYIITYYLPSGLFVIVSWISFLIPMDVIPGRMALLVTLFLVLVNIFNNVTTNTPKAEGLTAIEAWMLACILFVFGALIE